MRALKLVDESDLVDAENGLTEAYEIASARAIALRDAADEDRLSPHELETGSHLVSIDTAEPRIPAFLTEAARRRTHVEFRQPAPEARFRMPEPGLVPAPYLALASVVVPGALASLALGPVGIAAWLGLPVAAWFLAVGAAAAGHGSLSQAPRWIGSVGMAVAAFGAFALPGGQAAFAGVCGGLLFAGCCVSEWLASRAETDQDAGGDLEAANVEVW